MNTVRPDILQPAHDIIQWSHTLLKTAPLDSSQREDMQAVHNAARRFSAYAQSQIEIIRYGQDSVDLQRIRHCLRNHLNVIIGFTYLWIRILPDNLLLHMQLIRRIHTTGTDLMTQIEAIR